MKNETLSRPHFRHELKYCINEADYYGIRSCLTPVMLHDANAANGQYTLRSLYFDDAWDTAYQEKIMGVNTRKKYRIRIYNYSDAVIKLECKHKVDSYIYKESASLTHAEYDKIMENDCSFLLARKEPVCKAFYLDTVQRVLRPRVIVDYEREPFVLAAGDVRVTFDRDVRAAVLRNDIFDAKLPALCVLEPSELIMEVKFTSFLPQMVRELLPPKACEFVAVSKYVLCFNAACYRSTQE